ncbi:hypothetical protein CVT26_002795 [Gymnopilus dilepis]|uniref:Uncharacterized protein n=1 Tax=Gymnopilus dilepis TaxID=231916 RepID=A0A409Y3B6_9AGAR|nr:hypothetical protein CVT26_002795 [Gymnopilus dilepis]
MNNADEFFLPIRVPDHNSAVALSVIMLQQAVTNIFNYKESNDSPNRKKTEDLAFFLTMHSLGVKPCSELTFKHLQSSAHSNVSLLWITADELFQGSEQPENAACACAFTVHGLPHVRVLLAAHVCLEVLRVARMTYGQFSVVRVGWKITRDRATIIIVGDEGLMETYNAILPEGEPYDATTPGDIAWYHGMPVSQFGTPPDRVPDFADVDETFEDIK